MARVGRNQWPVRWSEIRRRLPYGVATMLHIKRAPFRNPSRGVARYEGFVGSPNARLDADWVLHAPAGART